MVSVLRKVAQLISGNILAQLVVFSSLPILSRLYTPIEFGEFAIFVSLVSILSVVSSGRYELAIMLPSIKKDYLAITKLSIQISVVFSALVGLGLLMAGSYFEFSSIEKSLIVVALISIGINRALQYFNNKKQDYNIMAKAKVLQSTSQVLVQLSTFSFGTLGLIGGHIIGFVVGLIHLLPLNFKKLKFNKVTVKDFALLKKYSDFPRYSVIGALADTTAIQLPVLIFSKYIGAYEVGVFSFALRVVSAPMTLMSTAITQVLYNNFVSDSKHGNLLLLTFKSAIVLFLVYLPIHLFLITYSESLFKVAFGDEWVLSGYIATILSYIMWIRFIVSPLSPIVNLKGNVKYGVAWQILYFLSLFSTLYYFRELEFESLLWVFVLHEIILYGIYFIIILCLARNND